MLQYTSISWLVHLAAQFMEAPVPPPSDALPRGLLPNVNDEGWLGWHGPTRTRLDTIQHRASYHYCGGCRFWLAISLMSLMLIVFHWIRQQLVNEHNHPFMYMYQQKKDTQKLPPAELSWVNSQRPTYGPGSRIGNQTSMQVLPVVSLYVAHHLRLMLETGVRWNNIAYNTYEVPWAICELILWTILFVRRVLSGHGTAISLVQQP